MRVEMLTDVTDAGATIHLLVRIEAQAPPSSDRPPINLALAIDRSSSMRGPRIAQATAAAMQVVEQLDARDRLAVITFDASARVVFGPAQMTDEAKEHIARALESMRTGVGTNLAAGIKKGVEAVCSGYVRGGLARLVLLTDGQPSMGILDSRSLAAIAEKEASRGVTITTMGLGESFDDELLAELAAHGRGGFHYLANAADIPGAFGRELAGVFAIAAARTELRLRPSGEISSVDVMHRLPSRPLDDGLTVELGELAAAAPRQVLFRLVRVPGARSRHCGTLSITYQHADGKPGDAYLLGIELPEDPVPAHGREITLERTRLAVAAAVDVAWARRASGDNMRALAALGDIKAEVLQLHEEDRADRNALESLLQDIAEAEAAVVKSSAERERARRSMRERSHITLLGHSTVRRLPPAEDE
jgi:uncharacterized protein YegL